MKNYSKQTKCLLFFICFIGFATNPEANTLTFLYENEYNETTSLAECRNSIDAIIGTPGKLLSYWTFSGKTLNNFGDLQSCETVARGQYMIVELSGDVYNETLFSNGGKGYFYQKMTSLIGLCVPKYCKMNELEYLKEFYHKQGSLFGFFNETLVVNFQFQRSIESIGSDDFKPIVNLLGGIVLSIILLMFVGTIIEGSQIGNRKDVIVIVDDQVVNALAYKDVNRKLLLEKERWTYHFLIFSIVRNNLHILCKKRRRVEIKQPTRKSQKLVRNLAIFDGMKALMSFQICYAMAFYCSYYHIIQFPGDASKITNDIRYLVLVEGAYDSTKSFFLISGFLQTFSFLSKYGTKPQFVDIFKFIGLRILKIAPVYYFVLILSIYVQQYVGSGPTWHLMDKITAQCTDKDQWFYNLLFVNNFYFDSGFEEYANSLGGESTPEQASSQAFSIQQRNTCLPWTWFYAVYMQLSVALPFCLYFLCHYMKQARVLHIVFIVFILTQKSIKIGALFDILSDNELSTIGVTNPSRNLGYYAYQYIKPNEHYISFMGFGATSGFIFHQYVQNIATKDDIQSDKPRSLDTNKIFPYLMYWKKNIIARIGSVSVALTIILIGIIVRASMNGRSYSKIFVILHAIFEEIFQNVAKMLIIAPMLLSKYKPLSYLLTLRGFALLSHLMLPMMVLMPIMFLRYYYELHQLLTLNFYQMVFYSIGTYIFTLPLAYFAHLLFRAPISAGLRIYEEGDLVLKGEKLLRFDFQFIDTEKLKYKTKKD